MGAMKKSSISRIENKTQMRKHVIVKPKTVLLSVYNILSYKEWGGERYFSIDLL